MKRYYYAVSGTMSNAIVVRRFASPEERDAWVVNEPISGVGSHYEHSRQAVTRREAYHQLAYNRYLRREYREYGAPYSDCYGTLGFED